MSNELKWRLSEVWNAAAIKEQRPLQKRDYIYASEIGYPLYDRYLKMKAVPYTNPPNNRALRKFLAGNIWEYVVKTILIATGIYHREEVKADATPYPGLMDVHGRLDFIAGGKVDADEAMARMKALDMPDYLYQVGEKIIEQLSGKTLSKRILELKSVSTFAMDKVERRDNALVTHQGQGYHYQKNANFPVSIAYICKDDCRMAEFWLNEIECEEFYHNDIEQMTYYFTKSKKPPHDPFAMYDELQGKFTKNISIEYSPYLSHYGFETPEQFRDAVSFVDTWNRVIDRRVKVELGMTTPTGQQIKWTDKNQTVLQEIKTAGFDVASIIEAKVKANEVEEESE